MISDLQCELNAIIGDTMTGERTLSNCDISFLTGGLTQHIWMRLCALVVGIKDRFLLLCVPKPSDNLWLHMWFTLPKKGVQQCNRF
jgi:hypothetical protein